MKHLIAPTFPFVISTTLTGLGCHLAGMSRPDLLVAIIFAAVVSGGVAYGSAWAGYRKSVRAAG
ncbi:MULTISPECIES: hypothetical protein [unclassified Verrucomicrobium]|uniref:hypothetical protein n=1 Tax=unclassified Verrucomicrobium TaxID=2625155 RepID=UPI0005709AEF|nr:MULTISPECIES: hypothetical protein [unclassified Verrucomicrobium]